MDDINEIFNTQRVLYECSCLLQKPLTHIFFCRYCSKIRCKDCVSHEVDSQYCQNCLEYIPTIDAKLKKNKCASCYQCPNCSLTLIAKTFLASVPSEADENVMVTKKAQVLQCSNCRWSTKDVKIPDQIIGSGGWPEVKIPHQERVEKLIDHYRITSQRERMEKEKKRINPRPGNAIHLLDKYGISAALSPKITESLRSKTYLGKIGTSPLSNQKALNEVKIEPSIPTDDIEPLDLEKYYNQELDLSAISSLEQRLMQVELQPEKVSNFYPISKMLYVKRSLRCKGCDRNLSKPEYNSSSIKFKITLSAFFQIPEVKISLIPPLIPFKECIVELTLKNPCQYAMQASIIPVNCETPTKQITGRINFTKFDLILECKDDTIEIDSEQVQRVRYNDDLNYIAFRRDNKVGIKIPVTPLLDTGECRVSFKLRHDFINSVTSMQSSGTSEPQLSSIEHIIYVNLGVIATSN